MELATFIVSLMLIESSISLAQHGHPTRIAPPVNMGRPFEKFSNQTMDEMITGAMGGVDVASNMILADNGHILAELDMYLSKEQFLNMYKPPGPEEMIKMGMMPAPLGTQNYNDPDVNGLLKDYKYSGIRTKRKATRDVRLRWTNSEVPYLFAKGHFDAKEEYLMRRSMTEWERYTCLKFRPATSTDKNSVRFQNGVGCNSQLGMVGGIQALNLQAPGCRYKGLYLHEIGHAIGLVHEHQLPDRDNYISVLYHNVAPHMRVWFSKYASNDVNQMTVPYEYSSVMHYGITAFAYDGKAQTIRAHDKAKEESIGKVYLKELAYSDVLIVNLMYNCSGHCPNQKKCGPDGFLNQNCDCVCKDGSSDCGTSKKAADDTCINIYDSWPCYIWANQGECERNPLYMKQQCSKACNVCGGSANTPDNNILWPWQWFPMFANMLPKEWTALGRCKDVYEKIKCQSWKERGDCVTNQRWMKDNCKSTCNLCGSTVSRSEASCTNKHEDSNKCAEWAKDGECSVNSNWMNTNCRRSCDMCLAKETNEEDEDGGADEDNMVCENTNPSCEGWAQTGECQRNPSWMISNCRKACQKCDDATCKNLYDDIQCKIWAQKLECVVNSDWMSKHCAKSCGRGACEGITQEPGITTTKATPVKGRKPTVRPTVSTDVPWRPQSLDSPAIHLSRRSKRGSYNLDGSCRNIHRSDTECEIWASSDHCSINPSWMRKNCARSCQACGTDDSGRTVTTTTQSSKANTCEDQESGCAVWAKHGFCDRNPKYNLIYCKKSCNNCNGCRDTEFLCAVWAKDGHCDKNAGYMLRQCQKSCKAC